MLSDGSSSYAATHGQFPARTQNALGHAETTAWDGKFGVALATTGPNGLVAESVYDSFGRKVKETPINGVGIYSTQDFSWCGAIGCSDGRSIYAVRSASTDGSESYAEFDRLGRQIHTRKRSFDGGWVYAEKYFDPLGREYLASDPYDPSAQSTRCWNFRSFDALGRVMKEWSSYATSECTSAPIAFDADPATTIGAGRASQTTYNLVSTNGIATRVVGNLSDASGYATQRTGYKIVNVMGRTRFVRDDLTGGGCPSDGAAMSGNNATCLQTEYDYDGQGNLTYTKQQDSAGTTIETRVVFNNRGFKTSMSDPDMGGWSYTYNTFGELLTQTDGKSQLTVLTYDKLGRMKTRAEGTEGTTTWNYDTATKGIGKLASITAPGSYAETYSYDDKGRLSQVKRQMGSAYFYIDQTYDSLGRVDTVKYPGSVNGDGSGSPEADANRLRVRNHYNAQGYLASVQDVSGTVYWAAERVDEAGRVTEEALGNGLITQRLYQRETGHLTHIRTGTSAGATQIQNLELAFDQAANLRVRKDRSPGVNAGAGIREQYGYDTLYRLTQTAQYNDTTNASLAATQLYSFDQFGNVLAKGTSYASYTYPTSRAGCSNTVNRPHAVYQVTAGNTRQYCYDANGNLVSATNARYSSLTWWVSNLVKRVTVSGTNYTEFTYGPDRARYKQYRYRSSSDAETTLYVGALYEKLTKVQGGASTIEHTHYIRAGDQVVATAKRTKVGSNPVGAYVYRYLHRDHLGSVTSITDAGGALIERSGFDPWGKRTDHSTWAAPVPLQFLPGGSGAGGTTQSVTSTKRGYTGHEHLDELGFIHMNGRIYDPEIGKFLSADPTMQFPESTQGFNRYAYAGNNPLTNVDPSGFSFFKKLFKWLGIAMTFILPTGINLLWERLLWSFTSGLLSTGGNLNAGLIAGLTAGLMHGIGSAFQRASATVLSDGTRLVKSLSDLQKMGKAALHGIVGGASAAASGGKFSDGFLGSFSGSLANSYIRSPRDPIARTAQAALIGGTVSVIGGGKFGNGAISAAFTTLYNDLAHDSPYSLDAALAELESDKSLSPEQKQARLWEMRKSLAATKSILRNPSTSELQAWFGHGSTLFGGSATIARDRLFLRIVEAIDKVDVAIMQSQIESDRRGGLDFAQDAAGVGSHLPKTVGPVVGVVGNLLGIFDMTVRGHQFTNRPFEFQVEFCNGAACPSGNFSLWMTAKGD